MNVPLYSVDTHVHYWHITAPHRLSGPVKSVFDEAKAGGAVLLISHVVIAELFYLFRKQGLGHEFAPFIGMVTGSGAYRAEGILIEDLRRLPDFDEIPEMHDRLIAIRADRLKATIVTKDASIRGCSRVKTLW
jgi:PIN domain nuclease of toxin-antitoxin system